MSSRFSFIKHTHYSLALLITLSFNAHSSNQLFLKDLLNLSLENPAILAKEDLVQATASQREGAKWQYYPTPVFSVQHAQVGAKDSSYQGDAMVANVGLQQPLWTGGKLDSGMEKANYEHQASLSALAEAKQDIQLRVVKSYSDWLSATIKIRVSDRNIETHEQLYARIERRVNEGLSAETDLTLALSRLQQAQADRYNATIQQQAALARLSQLIGREVSNDSFGITSARDVLDTAAESVNLALSTHPSIQKLSFTAQAALAEVGIQKANQYPDLVARVEQQYGNLQIKHTDPDARFFLTVQSKLGAGLSTFTAIDSAQLKYQSALSDIDATKRSVTELVLTEWTNAKQLKTRLSVLESALVSAQKISEAWDRQFISGKKSWLDVMNAARELSQTELQIAEVTGNLVNSSWQVGLLCQLPSPVAP